MTQLLTDSAELIRIKLALIDQRLSYALTANLVHRHDIVADNIVRIRTILREICDLDEEE